MQNCKIIDAYQTKVISNFKSAKQKLLKNNAAICFSKICRIIQLAPKYKQIKIKDKNWPKNQHKYYFL